MAETGLIGWRRLVLERAVPRRLFLLAGAAADPSFRAARELSDLVCEIAWLGETERDMALAMLGAFRDYLRARAGIRP